MKRILFIFLLIICSMVGGLLIQTSAEAKPAWKAAYHSTVIEFEKQENYNTTEKLYNLIYINNDKIPELVCSNGPSDSIYSFYDGKAVLLYEGGSGAGGDMGRYYIRKRNIMYGENADVAGALVGVI